MSLTNRQYDIILKKYDDIRNDNRKELNRRLTEIRTKIPVYEEIEDSISSICVERASLRIMGDYDPYREEDLKASLSKLYAQKKSLLKDNGYPSDYLDPIYTCPLCQDKGFINGEKCRCFKSYTGTLMYEQSNLGAVLNDENFSKLSYDYYENDDLKAFKKAVDYSHVFIDNFPSGENIFFFGSTGSGKTFLSRCITKEIMDKGFPALYFTAASLIDVLSGNVPFNDFLPGEAREFIYDCDLLIIDDLGSEYPSPFTVSKLFTCINTRLTNKKSTIISTNLDFRGIRDVYTDRIFSRIYDNYNKFHLNCPDIRLRRKIK